MSKADRVGSKRISEKTSGSSRRRKTSKNNLNVWHRGSIVTTFTDLEEAKRYVIARCRSATAFEPDDYAIEFPDGEMYSWSGRDWIGTNIVKHKVGAPAPDHLARVVRGPDRREVVNHPSHYGGDVEHEVIKCLEAWGLEKDALLWNAVKYIARHDKKGDPLENLKKAKFYLDRRIERLLSAWKSDI